MSDLTTLVRDLYAGAAAGSDLEAVMGRLVADDFVEHEELPPGMESTGRDVPRQLFEMMHAAFPDFHVDVHDVFADGDKVAARVEFVGTHEGEFMGAPPTGNTVRIQVIDIFEFRDDQVVAHWGLMDAVALMAQTGATAVP
jgi:steroid delta-isomerase-like uncharacterized protein